MKFLPLVAAVTVIATEALLAPMTAQAAPKIQSDALYFTSIQQDFDWFQSASASLPAKDTRQVFLRIYNEVSQEMPTMFDEKQFNHPEWVNALMLKYVSLYRNALECDESGKCPVSPAWARAFDENRRGRISPAGQLLLSISAHVNRDLPIALASIPETQFDDPTYHADFDRISLIFQRRMPALIKIVQEFQFCRVNPLDRKLIDEVINLAIGSTREQSWGWGKALLATKNQAEEDAVMKQIEHHAYVEDLSIYIVAPAPALLICI